MLKKWGALLLILALCVGLLPAVGEETELQPVLGQEITALAEEYFKAVQEA